MLQSTTQSQKVQLTEEEKTFFVKATDVDLRTILESLNQARRNIISTIDNDVSLTDHYKDRQGKYNDSFGDTPFRIGCRLLAEVVSKHVNDNNALLLDTGAGSGYLAAEASKLGFNNIDCLEPNKSMIDKQPKGLFGKVYQEMISLSKPCSIKTGTYDCVMSSGCVVSGHIEVEDFPEVFRIVKQGGYVVFNIPDFWYKYKNFGHRFDASFQEDLESGKLEMVVKERSVYAYPMEDATIYVLRKAMRSSYGNGNI